jgi:hypothetical protein
MVSFGQVEKKRLPVGSHTITEVRSAQLKENKGVLCSLGNKNGEHIVLAQETVDTIGPLAKELGVPFKQPKTESLSVLIKYYQKVAASIGAKAPFNIKLAKAKNKDGKLVKSKAGNEILNIVSVK